MNIDYDKMWEEVIKEIDKEELQEGEISVKMFSEKYNISNRQALSKLGRLERAGLVTKRIIRRRGGKCYLYRPIINDALSK